MFLGSIAQTIEEPKLSDTKEFVAVVDKDQASVTEEKGPVLEKPKVTKSKVSIGMRPVEEGKLVKIFYTETTTIFY